MQSTTYRYSTTSGPPLAVTLPSPEEFLMDGVTWGSPYCVPSVAYWGIVARMYANEVRFQPRRIGGSLVEQVAYCLIGGFGMRAELGNSAYKCLLEAGLIRTGVAAAEIEEILRRPMMVAGRSRRYRFPRQRARYLATAIQHLGENDGSTDAHELRSALMELPGVGYKTASWVVRDWLASDDVAVIDIHIERACRAIGVFAPAQSVQQDYLDMEQRFLHLAKGLRIRASVLDNVMWETMRTEGAVLGTA